MSDILALAAQVSGSKSLLDKVIEQTNTLYKMEIHSVGAYDSAIVHSNQTEEGPRKSDEDLLKILDGLPDV
jgi:hypothetical protein